MDALLKFNRRLFLKYSLSTAVLAALGDFRNISIADSPKQVKVTILHTNDWHSRVDPFPMSDRNYPGMGGAESRAALIQQIRTEEEHVLLLDAGDIFQGTPYFNFYGGELEYKLMTAMGYDCVTLGNHDFDNGIDGLLKQMPYAGFDWINSNYDFSGTKLAGMVKPYKVIQKERVRIGILGVGIELKGLVPDQLFDKVQYLDPVENANRVALYLKRKEKCDLIICLSHLGYHYDSGKISDQVFARSSENIDLIIGGHTHTFLDKPQRFINRVGKEILVNQVGWAGLAVGRIDFYFDKGLKPINYQSSLHKIEKQT